LNTTSFWRRRSNDYSHEKDHHLHRVRCVVPDLLIRKKHHALATTGNQELKEDNQRLRELVIQALNCADYVHESTVIEIKKELQALKPL
jgi:hypothetical protein